MTAFLIFLIFVLSQEENHKIEGSMKCVESVPSDC